LKRTVKITLTIAITVIVASSIVGILADFASADTSTPLPRSGHEMVYDTENNQVIMFGGEVSGGNLVDFEATLIFSSQNQMWTKLSDINSPEGRTHHRMVYNSLTGKIFLFGGISNTEYALFNDTWVFDPITDEWTELHPANSPSGRSAHAMYFDPEFNEVVLYGGVTSPSSVSSEMWVYNFNANNWNQIYPTYGGPGVGYGHSFVYDENKQVGVFFGGRFGNMYLRDDIWFFNRSSISWVKKYLISKPLARYYTGMVYNPTDANFIMFGGDNEDIPLRALGDTWIFSAQSNVWSEIETSTSPPPRCKHAMVFDQYLDKVILFGGLGESFSVTYDDLWIYDPITMSWSQEFTIAASAPLWITLLSFVSVSFVSRFLKSKFKRDKNN